MGAYLAGASVEHAEKLYSFGENMGIAFQIHDDMLDTFGDSSVTGKQQGGDILRGKKNFLYTHTINELSGVERIKFITAYQQAAKDENINPVLETYNKLQVGKYASTVENNYFNAALHSLKDIPRDTSMLLTFASILMERNS